MVALDLLTYAPFLVDVVLVAGEREAGLEGEPAIGDLTLEVQPEDLGARGDLLTIVIDPIVVARVVGDTVLRLVLVVREDVEQTGVEAFERGTLTCAPPRVKYMSLLRLKEWEISGRRSSALVTRCASPPTTPT